MKSNIILKHAGGELANQLWNYISIYAYSIDIGAQTRNPSFYEYHRFFHLINTESLTTKILSSFFQAPRRRNHPINKYFRLAYKIGTKIITKFRSNQVLSSENTSNCVFYLPPSKELSRRANDIYFLGWLFRNPIGIEKYRPDIIQAFKPIKKIEDRKNQIISSLKNKYQNIIGLHIRQGDYKKFRNGQYLIDQKRVAQICSEYLQSKNLNKKETVFLITSDGPIDPHLFSDLETHISQENAITDLFLLASTFAIIGSDSSFGHFASWYGNIPHIVLKNQAIDWEYYKDKDKYFVNKYLELLPL